MHHGINLQSLHTSFMHLLLAPKYSFKEHWFSPKIQGTKAKLVQVKLFFWHRILSIVWLKAQYTVTWSLMLPLYLYCDIFNLGLCSHIAIVKNHKEAKIFSSYTHTRLQRRFLHKYALATTIPTQIRACNDVSYTNTCLQRRFLHKYALAMMFPTQIHACNDDSYTNTRLQRRFLHKYALATTIPTQIE